MKKILFIISLIVVVCSCGHKNRNTINEKKNSSVQKCAITNIELIAWIYKNRMDNEELNGFPQNRVSVVVFTDLKNQPHFLKGIQPNDTIIDLSVFGKREKKIIGYKGITTLLDDTIMIFDYENIGGKYYDRLLLQNYPIDKIPLARLEHSKKSIYIVCAIYNLYPESGKLKLWSK